MTGNSINVAGIEIPSTDPAFLVIVGVHIVLGLVCTVSGIVAMLSPKRAGRHPWFGKLYFWSLTATAVDMSARPPVGEVGADHAKPGDSAATSCYRAFARCCGARRHGAGNPDRTALRVELRGMEAGSGRPAAVLPGWHTGAPHQQRV
jgi:hypothetical protein